MPIIFVFVPSIPHQHVYQLLRIPISFKSISDGEEYNHIILAVKFKNLWGALGISRLSNLMFKALKYNSLSDLILEFDKSYEHYFHKLVNVSIGLPFSHNRVSETPLQWKVLTCSIDNGSKTWQSHKDTFNRYSKDCSFIATYFEATGKLPSWCNETYRTGKEAHH